MNRLTWIRRNVWGRVRAVVVAAALVAAGGNRAMAAESLPAKPLRHFNDEAALVAADVATRLDQKLAQFERETSNQFVVAIFPKLPPGAALEDFTVRTAESWGVGRKKEDNGVVLFVFATDRKVRFEIGYGLEGALPDSLAERIIRNDIAPHFRRGDYATGLEKGIDAVIASAKGEYKGSGRALGDRQQTNTGWRSFVIPLVLLLAIVLIWRATSERGRSYSRRGIRRWHGAPGWSTGGWGGWGGGSGSGGGFGGGFSGGGGSFGGGGASGDW